jgi:hypothetical protein
MFGEGKYLYHVIFKENKVPYGQDFSYFRGVPKDVIFEVHAFMDDKATLTGYGYGVLNTKPYDDQAYGNGHMFVSLKDMNKALKDKKAKKVKHAVGVFDKPAPRICKCCGGEIRD